MIILIMILSIFSNLVIASNDPQDFIAKHSNKNAWFAYIVKAQADTRSMCCWQHNNSNNSVCNLGSKINSFGSNDDSPITENINIYVKLKDGKVDNIIPLGDQCQVNTKNLKINWLDTVQQKDSINWLQQVTQSNNAHENTNALYALALHKDNKASQALFEIAQIPNGDNSQNAIFWLGESRLDGVDYLQKLYKTLPHGKARRHINFALTETKSPQGIKLLKQIAAQDKDPEQRGDALFWLSQSNADGVIKILLNSVKNDPSDSIKEKAIFSLSQIENQAAVDALLDIVKNNKSVELKDKALFWLAEVSPRLAKQIVFKILKDPGTESRINNAVFTLSQLSEEENNDDALFQLIAGNYTKQVKKQALFWLSQSENSATIDKLQKLL